MSKKVEKNVFDDLVEDFYALYNGEQHRDFEFIHNDPQNGDYIDRGGYEAHILFHRTLILVIICLKKFQPDHPFFYPKAENNPLFDGFNFNNWEHVSKAHEIERKLLVKIKDLSSEINKLNKSRTENLSKHIEKESVGSFHNKKINNEIKKISQNKYELEKERIKISSFLEIQNKGIVTFIKRYFPLLNDKYIAGNNGIYDSWDYLRTCLVLPHSNSNHKTSQDYVIDMCNSIPKQIIDEQFFEFIEKITFNKNLNKKIESSTFELLYQLSKDYNSKSICSINPEFLLIYNNCEISLMPSYESRYETLKEYSLFNNFYIKNSITGQNNFRGLIDFFGETEQSSDLFIGSFHEQISNDKEQFEKYVEGIFKTLKDEGTAIILINKDDNTKLSNKIKNLKFEVESIISLLNYSCVILKKTEKTEKIIKIFEGLDFIKEDSGSKKLYSQDLIKSFKEKNKAYYKEISCDEFLSDENDRSFDISRYFMPDFKGESLQNFLIPIKGTKKFQEFSGLTVKIADLTNELFDSQFENKLEIKTIPQGFRKIDESCLMLASKGIKLKPTYFDYKGVSVFVSSNISTFKIKNSLLPDFLKLELDRDKVKTQLKFIQSGNVIPFFKENDILNKIKIDVPSIPEQEMIISSSFNQYLESIKENFSSSKIEYKKTYKEVFDDMDHRIGGYLLAINLASKRIDKYTNQLDSYEDMIRPKLEKIKLNISNITKLIESYTTKIYYNEVISCFNVINLIQQEFDGLQLQYLKIETNFEEYIGDYKQNGIEISLEPLKQLIHEIIKNAQKYGGGFSNKAKNSIIINFRLSNNNLLMNIKNNGQPMNPLMNKDSFVKKGSTSDKSKGKGFGGPMIDEITKDFENCSWDLINNKNLDYPVEFIFKFELQQLE